MNNVISAVSEPKYTNEPSYFKNCRVTLRIYSREIGRFVAHVLTGGSFSNYGRSIVHSLISLTSERASSVTAEGGVRKTENTGKI